VTKKKMSYSAPALEKGLDILELLARRDEALSLARIAEELGRSTSEIFRMVMVLLERDYLCRRPVTDDLALTDRLFSLGLRTPRVRDLVTEAVPVMNALTREIGHSVHLVVLYRGRTVVLASVSGEPDISFTLNLGFSRPAVDATSGRVIISFQPPQTQQRLIQESLPQAKGRVNEKELTKALRSIRDQGFELHKSRDFVGFTDICCPIQDRSGHAIASVIVTCIRRHATEERLLDALDALKRACAAIGQAVT
jgi:DNA-binding IclR family transcriptional regulator